VPEIELEEERRVEQRERHSTTRERGQPLAHQSSDLGVHDGVQLLQAPRAAEDRGTELHPVDLAAGPHDIRAEELEQSPAHPGPAQSAVAQTVGVDPGAPVAARQPPGDG
jgi:hypothetical protein